MAQVSSMASGPGSGTIAQATSQDLVQMLTVAHMQYSSGRYTDALSICETIYSIDAYRTENLLLLGAIHFQVTRIRSPDMCGTQTWRTAGPTR